ncbi:MAG: hypothetical protein Q4B50_06130, partial [Bacillota bacterium]|nr:hypothetical protein [Bacillota bacterium]
VLFTILFSICHTSLYHLQWRISRFPGEAGKPFKKELSPQGSLRLVRRRSFLSPSYGGSAKIATLRSWALLAQILSLAASQ